MDLYSFFEMETKSPDSTAPTSSPQLKFLTTQLKKLSELQNPLKFYQENGKKLNGGGPALGSVVSNWKAINPVDKHEAPINSIIIDLNDRFKWSREQIADWLDTLDNQPVFYPDIAQPKSEHTNTYIRITHSGPANAVMMWSCGCAITNYYGDWHSSDDTQVAF